jgi:hypothetical protein
VQRTPLHPEKSLHGTGRSDPTTEGDGVPKFLDKVKQGAGKAKDLAAKNSDKITGAVDKATDFVDKKTKGKYAEKLQKVDDAAHRAVDKLDGAEDEAAAQPVEDEPEAT